MLKRVPQPPVNPALRDREHHEFWPGFIVGLIGVILFACGVQHLTGVDTVDGGTAWETQLTKAFSSGGLRYPGKTETPPPPPEPNDSNAAADALERWARLQANTPSPAWKVRVDTAAKTPCPT